LSGDVTQLDAEDFLELVWGKREGWVDLPAKVGGYWVPYHLHWDGNGAGTEVSRRVDACLRDGEDLYFSVGQFTEKGRDYEELMPSHWLWADLDEVHPSEAGKVGLTPTVAWESSRGRYQALWRLDRDVRPETLDKLNQSLSYHLGADSGGWDRTQVLRVVGTRNFKYPEAPMVQLLWYDPALQYDPRKIWATVKSSYRPVSSVGESVPSNTRGPLPASARALLRVPADSVVEGERSTQLWKIECLLAESGWGEDAIYEVVSQSAWNKWARVRTGETRLRREIRKAIRHVLTQNGSRGHGSNGADTVQLPPREESSGTKQSDDRLSTNGEADVLAEVEVEDDDVDTSPSPFVRYASFMAMEMEAPRWMIEDIWTQNAHGIIGGEPKTSKTTLALAMAISVASGKPFLGRYEIHAPGPVLMVQEENAPWNMQDRMRKIASSYGLISQADVTSSSSEEGSIASTSVSLDFPTDIPFRLLNNHGMDLSVEEHRDLLEAEISAVRPVLVILDPLYLLFGGNADLDKLKDVRPFLQWIMQLRYEYETAIALIHHFRKQQAGVDVRPGQRVMGSNVFHGWVASALYCSAREGSGSDDGEDGVKRVKVEREFREQPPQKPLDINLTMGQPGDLEFSAEIVDWDAGGQLLQMVQEEPGVTVNQLAEQLGVGRKVVLRRARGTGKIREETGKRGRGFSTRLYPE